MVAPEEGNVALLRAVTDRLRLTMVPDLTRALRDCECWTRTRAGTASGLQLSFEVPLRAVAELYSRLSGCGLEFDRGSHRELALLCTLRQHALTPGALRRTVELRLEVTFADEVDPMYLPVPAGVA